jgi:hypothetical protein
MDAYSDLIRLMDEKRLEDRAIDNARWEETKKFIREVKANGCNEVKRVHEYKR